MPETNVEAKLSSPWYVQVQKIKALFAYDAEVSVVYDDEDPYNVRLYVDNPTKADALDTLMPDKYEFGNVTLGVDIVPSNEEVTAEQRFRIAFDGNPVFSGSISVDVPGGKFTYAVFEPDVAQFRNDDISSAFGVATMTYEDVARDVFTDDSGVFICSDLVSCDEVEFVE
ncbi:MAG: hypothetical protein IKF14_13430 [Atopobiaceae bacterium]|nr:hypothetical protein [Atopobiaceae bacterium]